MPSMFRNWFGGSSNDNKSAKTHTRSKSTPNIYATPGTAPSTPASRPDAHRHHSYSTTHSSHSAAPSPLRYETASTDTRTKYGYGRRGSSSSHTDDLRPQVLRRASHKPKGSGKYIPAFLSLAELISRIAPIYTPSTGQFTPASSRSNSNSSLFTSMSSPYGSSRSDSGHHMHHGIYAETRPPLTTNHSWQTTGSVGSTSSCKS
jgi:hypothetical protein